MFLKLSALIAVAAIIFLSGMDYGMKKKQAKCQEKEIKSLEQETGLQNEIIKINSYQKKMVNETAVNNDTVARSEWLRLYFEELEATN